MIAMGTMNIILMQEQVKCTLNNMDTMTLCVDKIQPLNSNFILSDIWNKMARRYNTEDALEMLFDPSFLESVLDQSMLVPNPLENADIADKEYDSISKSAKSYARENLCHWGIFKIWKNISFRKKKSGRKNGRMEGRNHSQVFIL